MKIHHNALVAVADGSKFNLFQNVDSQGGVSLKALQVTDLDAHSGGSGGRHQDSSANPSHGQVAEDDFAASVAAYIEKAVAGGASRQVVLVAAPKTLGELRKQISKSASVVIVGELAKDLTSHSVKDVQKAIETAE